MEWVYRSNAPIKQSTTLYTPKEPIEESNVVNCTLLVIKDLYLWFIRFNLDLEACRETFEKECLNVGEWTELACPGWWVLIGLSLIEIAIWRCHHLNTVYRQHAHIFASILLSSPTGVVWWRGGRVRLFFGKVCWSLAYVIVWLKLYISHFNKCF